MEQVHGVDVSWMTQGSPKDRINKKPPSPPAKTPGPAQPRQIPGAADSKPTSADSKSNVSASPQTNGHAASSPTSNGSNTSSGRRRSRSGSLDKNSSPSSTPPGRRNSWFSNISAKFSSNNSSAPAGDTHTAAQQQDQDQGQEEEDPMSLPSPTTNPSGVPKVNPMRSAVLPPAAKPNGNGPYTPAPPKSGQAGFLGVFRRLSSSSTAAHAAASKMGNGLVERKILNVDQERQRCPISELKDSKLRKVSFCVDVEIAPMPKYADAEPQARAPVDNTQKKKLTEKGEGEALKNPKAMEDKRDAEGSPMTLVETVSSEAEREPDGAAKPTPDADKDETPAPGKEKELTKKKEKKKKSEEERKARKEKKRKLAEANGSVPMEIRYDSSDSSETPDGTGTPKSSPFPTINPARIYRRCCQLRETPILKKITEQLLDPANSSSATGMVNKLDLTGYWLQSGDVATLGDYLAVVPVREVLLGNSNLEDEGLRLILAGLLAARPPDLKRRKPKHELQEQGGVVERLVIKNNKFGPDGWKHLSLFLYLCRSLKYLDVSHVQFPRQAGGGQTNGTLANGQQVPRGIAEVFSTALAKRLGGPTLELLNIGETEPTMDQLGTIIDGVIESGVCRLGLAHNHLNEKGVEHLARFLAAGKCEGLDLGGNDLRDHMEIIISSLKETDPLWALSLSGCNLKPASLCKILPDLAKLSDFRFIDLSHNHDLFQSTPSAVGLLRRYLPKMEPLKRIHLQDVAMTSEQAIALVEVLPELHNLAHVNILENAELMKLVDARTEEAQEEACALYASLMAAVRLSKSLICIDIEVPSDQSGEIVKAMAKQVVAYCLRNMERIPDSDIGSSVATAISENQAVAEKDESKLPGYPDVLAHLVGHDVLDQSDSGGEEDPAPDEDYVIGGTGVVKALTCCLKNRGDESRRQSGEFVHELEEGEVAAAPKLVTGGKAKDMSKHLLAGARKIRQRIQPALNKAKSNPSDEQNLRKLMFLDETLQGIIKRFEDEFPDTREGIPKMSSPPPALNIRTEELSTSPPVEDAAAASDGDDESKIHPPKTLSRSSSLSKLLAEEEGRVLRAGHRFRSGFFTQEHIDLLNSIDDIGSDPKHVQLLTGMAEDIGGELFEMVTEKGPVRTFKEDRDLVLRCMKEADPDHFEKFAESQHKARANISVSTNEKNGESQQVDESAIAD